MMDLGPNARRLAWWLLIAAALLSLGYGFYEAVSRSNDFQWSPSRLMWQGINPYETYLTGDKSLLILDQAPNYGHFLYVILLPIALLPWALAKPVWAVVNLAFLAYCAVQCHKLMQSSAQQRWWQLALVLVCVGYPIKIAIGNGQHALLCLFGVMLALLYRDKPWLSGLGLALLACKYSFGLFIGLVMVVNGYWGSVAVGAALTLGAWLFVSLWTHSAPLSTLFQPLIVASQDVPKGFFDLTSLLRMLAAQYGLPMWVGAALIVAVNVVFFTLMWRRRHAIRQSLPHMALALGSAVMMSLGTVYHLGYDLTVSIFWIAALLMATPHRIAPNTIAPSTKAALLALFLIYWTLPRAAKFLSPNPLLDPSVVALLALGLTFAGFWSLRKIPVHRAQASIH
jgi:hypothetical protein